MRTLRVLLVAEEAAGLRALELLAASPHAVVAVCTSGKAQHGASAVAGRAKALGVPLRPAEVVSDETFAYEISAAGIDLLLNVHSLRIAHPAVIAAVGLGAFNLHPGPLPEYAGLSVPSWAIFNGERSHAVTLHRMEAQVDSGPVAFVARYPIREHDTGLTVSAAATTFGVPLIGKLMKAASTGTVPAEEQDPARRRWYPRAGPFGGQVPWRLPARRIVDLVRASDYSPLTSPWGAPITVGKHGPVELVRARATGESATSRPGTVERAEGEAVLVAGRDELVAIERVRAHGSRKAAIDVLEPGDRLAPGPEAS